MVAEVVELFNFCSATGIPFSEALKLDLEHFLILKEVAKAKSKRSEIDAGKDK